MSKKSKPTKQKKTLTMSQSYVDKWLDSIGNQLMQRNYAEAAAICERLLSALPPRDPQRSEILNQLGIAQAMQQNFAESYAAYTEAIALNPKNVDLWVNRGVSSRHTSRFGRSLLDLEHAKEMNTIPQLTKQIDDELKIARRIVKESLQQRGPNFTLEQLVEQENHFQDGLQLMQAGQWQKAERAFRASIEMGDCLPQPWGNIGICLLMQEHYDEAEASFKQALLIDPKYDLAKRNLKLLPQTRRTGPPTMIGTRDPFKNANTKQSIIVIKE